MALSQSQWSAQQADEYTNALFDTMQALADDPGRGKPCDDIHPGMRRYARGSHTIFYLRNEKGAEIVRVLHSSIDFAAHLANDDEL
jgi:toxin ParE1/3/4